MRHNTDTVSEFHDLAPQAIASKGLAQGPYVAAKAGFEPATLRTKDAESTNVPPPPILIEMYSTTTATLKLSHAPATISISRYRRPEAVDSFALLRGSPVIPFARTATICYAPEPCILCGVL